MKETPIIFSGPMVRAILDGRKTQTRIVTNISQFIILQHENGLVTWDVHFKKAHKGVWSTSEGTKASAEFALQKIKNQYCPYGQPGDRLWVREAWRFSDPGDLVIYRADYNEEEARAIGGWKSPIYMTRRLCRIALGITGVRLERVQEINAEDAIAEGAPFINPPVSGVDLTNEEIHGIGCQFGFIHLWDSIHAKKGNGWEENPLVWVLEFEVKKE